MGWTEGSHDGRGEGGRGVEKGIMVSVGGSGERNDAREGGRERSGRREETGEK